MRIVRVLIESRIQEKLAKKHGVSRKEVEAALVEGHPLFFRARGGRYVAFARGERQLTIIFTYRRGIATVHTAYPSSDWQIRLYRRRHP